MPRPISSLCSYSNWSNFLSSHLATFSLHFRSGRTFFAILFDTLSTLH